MTQTTRRHHYVWRFHLAAWAVSGKVAVLRKDGTGYSSNPINVAVERDFYRLPRLTMTEIAFIGRFIDTTFDSELRKKVARGWLEPAMIIGALREHAESRGSLSQEMETAFDKIELELDEKVMGDIERRGQPLIERLRIGDASFWPEDQGAAIDFSHFIAVQHLRTKRIQDAIREIELPFTPVEVGRIWPIMRHVLSTSFGFSLFSERWQWTLRTIRATGQLRFITADQPVMNLMKGVGHNDMALYYPVSPEVAVLMEHPANPPVVEAGGDLDDWVVQDLNRRLFEYSHEQVIGTDIDYLRSIAR